MRGEFCWPQAFDPEKTAHLSASSVGMLLRCEQQYAFRYFEGIKAPPSAAMVQGSSVDEAANLNFKQKIQTTQDLPLADVLDAAADSWKKRSSEIEQWKMSPGEAKDGVVNMAKAHHAEIAPKIQPVAVQEQFWLYSGEWDLPVMGYKDVRTELATRDLKTNSRSKSAADLESDIQAGIYLFVDHVSEQPELFIWDQITQLKAGPKVTEIPRVGTQEDYDIIIRVVAAAEARIAYMHETGLFMPADPSGWACGFCSYGDHGICPYVKK